jgi:hypothetical protein
MVSMPDFLERLRQERKNLGLNQGNMSALFEKEDPGFYGKKENGLHPLPVQELIIILDRLGFDIMNVFQPQTSSQYPEDQEPLIKEVVDIMTSEDEGTKKALEQNVHMFSEKIKREIELLARIEKLERICGQSSAPPPTDHNDVPRGSPPTKRRGSSGL